MRMSKESKRGKEEKERKLETFENEKFSIVCQSLLHWNTHHLMFSLSSCYFGTMILAISCFHCLQNDDVIEFALFCRGFFYFLL